jgi:hypothetical protein
MVQKQGISVIINEDGRPAREFETPTSYLEAYKVDYTKGIPVSHRYIGPRHEVPFFLRYVISPDFSLPTEFNALETEVFVNGTLFRTIVSSRSWITNPDTVRDIGGAYWRNPPHMNA